MMLETGRVIGVPVTAGTFKKVTRAIVDGASRDGGYVCVANVHMVTIARRSAGFLRVLENAKLVTSDGMPLVWALRQQGFEYAERVAGADLVGPLCELAAKEGLPVYFFGSTPKTVKSLNKVIARRFPTLQVAGCESPPVLPQRPVVDPAVVERINASGARIVFVGLGCPKQEFWMEAYTPHLSAVLVGVGAVFDLMAGTVPRAPLWMQRLGLEWLYRLAVEPRRLWKRYLVTNTLFCWYLAVECLRGYLRGERSDPNQGG
jgi:N-acetylglucosaminyldiphosphoundecaprenol N-acetyl-beta-D-mannosaminyltransferase